MLSPGPTGGCDGIQLGSVVFHAAVTDSVGTIVRHVFEDFPKYLVKPLFSFRSVEEGEVPEVGSSRSKGCIILEGCPVLTWLPTWGRFLAFCKEQGASFRASSGHAEAFLCCSTAMLTRPLKYAPSSMEMR